MATGDILSVAINAGGRSGTGTVEGFVDGAAYAFGTRGSTSTSNCYFTVESPSVDNALNPTTVTRTVYGTIVERSPGTANPNETESGGDLVFVFALDEPIYDGDTITACNLKAGLVTNSGSGGGSETSAAYTGSVTNNSTREYPLPRVQWDMMPWDRVTGDFRVAVLAGHKFGIRAVRLTATGAVSAHSQSVIVTSQTIRQFSLTEKYLSAWAATIPIAGFTQGEKINLKAEPYSIVGGTTMDTDDNSAHYVVAGDGPIYVVCDKTGALRQYAVVNAGTGDDGTGVVSGTLATAEASPYATIKGAIDDDATCVYLQGSPHSFADRSTVKTTDQWIEVRPHPSEASEVVVSVPSSFPNPACVRIKFFDVRITPAGPFGFFYAPGRPGHYIAAERCVGSSGTTLAECWVDFDGVFFKDCEFEDGTAWKLTSMGTDRFRFWHDGNLVTNTGPLKAWWRLAGCEIEDGTLIEDNAAEGDEPYNSIIASTSFTKQRGTITLFSQSASAKPWMVNVLIEGVTADVSPGQLLSIAEDSAFDIDHPIISHVTVVGQRSNLFYNSSGSTAYYSRDILFTGGIFTELDTKHDDFGTPDANRIGRWEFNYGCGLRGNMSIQDNFDPEYPGYPWVLTGDPDFVDDLTGSTGGGDYHLGPDTDAPLLPANDVVTMTCDMDGVTWRNDGTDRAGAFNVLPTSARPIYPAAAGRRVGVTTSRRPNGPVRGRRP